MGAWKKLNQQDAFVTTYNAKKSWSIKSGSFSGTSIQTFLAQTSSNTSNYQISPGDLYTGDYNNSGSYKELNYRSVNQLYYNAFDRIKGGIIESSSFEHYRQTSFEYGSRYLRDSAFVFSIPRDMFGTHIEPGSIQLGYKTEYVSPQNDYVVEGFFDAGPILDDGEGNLVISQSAKFQRIGNIFYSHGMIVVTDTANISKFENDARTDMSWKSNHPIYTYNYHCKISDYEFNHTQNKSAVTGTDKHYKDIVTGSNFQPYITTVGLYNDTNELVAVAKLSQPLPKPANTEMTIQIKLDI